MLSNDSFFEALTKLASAGNYHLIILTEIRHMHKKRRRKSGWISNFLNYLDLVRIFFFFFFVS